MGTLECFILYILLPQEASVKIFSKIHFGVNIHADIAFLLHTQLFLYIYLAICYALLLLSLSVALFSINYHANILATDSQ